MATMTMTAGALRRRETRVFLNSFKEQGVSYREAKALLDSHFTIYGPAEALKQIKQAVERITDARFVFLIEKTNPKQARQIAQDNSVKLKLEKMKTGRFLATFEGPKYRVIQAREEWEALER